MSNNEFNPRLRFGAVAIGLLASLITLPLIFFRADDSEDWGMVYLFMTAGYMLWPLAVFLWLRSSQTQLKQSTLLRGVGLAWLIFTLFSSFQFIGSFGRRVYSTQPSGISQP